MPEQKPTSSRVRAWQSESGLWSGLRDAAREFRAKPTPAEERLWLAIRNRKLGGARFRRQHAIGRFLVDFYCADAKLVIEVDGPVHENQVERDTERQHELEARSLTVIRFTNDEVLQDLGSVLHRIAGHLSPNPYPISEREP